MRDDRVGAARRVSVCGSGRVLRLEIVDFLQRSSRGLMISAWQPGLAVDMSAWRGARELPRSPPREPPDPSPRVSDITSPRSWSALESSFESSDDDGSSDDDEPETLLYVAPRGRFATGGVGAVGRPAGVTRRAPPLHAYVSSLTGEPCAPLGQDDTTPRHRCATSGVTTAYAHEHHSPGWTGSRSDDDGSGASSMDDDRPLHRAERAERRRAAAESAARREARAMERERRRRHSRTVRRGPACHLPRNLNGCHDNNQNFWTHPWDDPSPRTLRALCVDACAAVLRGRTRLPPAMAPALVDETMDRCALDVRVLAMCLAAGATKLRLRDFAAVPNVPLTAAWRCWQEDSPACVGVSRPPPTRSTPIPAAMVEVVDRILQTRVEGWTKLFGLADTLETVALECGETGEDDESHGYLRETIAELCGTRSLRKMALGFFERVTDDTLRPLWGGGGEREREGGGTSVEKAPLASSSMANRAFVPPPVAIPPPVTALTTPPALTRLDLSHLPLVTDLTVRSVLCHCQTLRELRLEFLPVTDACIAHWRVALRNLTWLEVKSCPHMRFAYPDVDWSRPPDKLRTLRIQPGGAPENWGYANSERDMRVSARHLHQLSFAKKSAIAHLCLGCEFAAPEGENKKLGVGGNVGGYRSETVWDLREAPLRGVTHLELYRARQIIWPRRLARWTDCLESLVVETSEDGLIHRLLGVATLRRLVVCDCSEMDVDEFVALGKLTTLTELRCGGVGERLAPFAGDVKAAIGERLVEAHFHSCVEYPVEESLFD